MLGPTQSKPDEKIGIGKLLLGGLAALVLLALGIGLLAAPPYEIWLLSRLRDHGLQASADVHFDGLVQEHERVAVRETTTTAVGYSYFFQVQGNSYQGSASSSNVDFMAALQKDAANGGKDSRWPMRVGSVTVTYLPEDPAQHRFGSVGQPQVAAVQRQLWWSIPLGIVFVLAGGLVVCGCCCLIRDELAGRPAGKGA